MSKEIYVEVALVEKQRGRPFGGIGLIVIDENACIAYEDWERFGRTTDLMYLEVSAFLEGLKYASDGDVIYTSSEYCVKGFHEWLEGWRRRGWRKASKKPVANSGIWQKVDKLRAEKNVEVRKVDAFSAGKDAAYRLALSVARGQL